MMLRWRHAEDAQAMYRSVRERCLRYVWERRGRCTGECMEDAREMLEFVQKMHRRPTRGVRGRCSGDALEGDARKRAKMPGAGMCCECELCG